MDQLYEVKQVIRVPTKSQIIHQIASKLINLNIQEDRIKSINKKLEKLPDEYFSFYNVDEIIRAITQSNKELKMQDPIDELSKIVGVKSNNNTNTNTNTDIIKLYDAVISKQLKNIINPSSNYVKHYITFDSFNRDLSASTDTFFQWRYAATANPQDGTINSFNPINNVIGLRIYQPIFPIFMPMTNNYVNSRMSILVEEFKSQAFIASNTRSYHFMLRSIPTANNKFLECQILNETFIFRKPITEFSTLSLTFADPLNLMPINVDRANCQFTYGATTTISTNIPLVVNIGDYVIFNDFTTANPTQDAAVIAQMNNPVGIYITSVTSTTKFVVGINTTSITPINTLQIIGYLASYRFIVSMEVLSIKSDYGN